MTDYVRLLPEVGAFVRKPGPIRLRHETRISGSRLSPGRQSVIGLLLDLQMDQSPILDRIRAAGVLRVGTTGDYTPFSLLQPDGSYAGADIDMAHDLAETIGVRVVFVPTVWVDLLDDFL